MTTNHLQNSYIAIVVLSYLSVVLCVSIKSLCNMYFAFCLLLFYLPLLFAHLSADVRLCNFQQNCKTGLWNKQHNAKSKVHKAGSKVQKAGSKVQKAGSKVQKNNNKRQEAKPESFNPSKWHHSAKNTVLFSFCLEATIKTIKAKHNSKKKQKFKYEKQETGPKYMLT